MAKEKYRIETYFQGSWNWLIFWVLIFWPIAVVYFFMRRKPAEVPVTKDKFKNKKNN